MPEEDYYNDPDAPTANSIVVAVAAIVRNDDEIVMIERTDNNLWAIRGGALTLRGPDRGALARLGMDELGSTPAVRSTQYADPPRTSCLEGSNSDYCATNDSDMIRSMCAPGADRLLR